MKCFSLVLIATCILLIAGCHSHVELRVTPQEVLNSGDYYKMAVPDDARAGKTYSLTEKERVWPIPFAEAIDAVETNRSPDSSSKLKAVAPDVVTNTLPWGRDAAIEREIQRRVTADTSKILKLLTENPGERVLIEIVVYKPKVNEGNASFVGYTYVHGVGNSSIDIILPEKLRSWDGPGSVGPGPNQDHVIDTARSRFLSITLIDGKLVQSTANYIAVWNHVTIAFNKATAARLKAAKARADKAAKRTKPPKPETLPSGNATQDATPKPKSKSNYEQGATSDIRQEQQNTDSETIEGTVVEIPDSQNSGAQEGSGGFNEDIP